MGMVELDVEIDNDLIAKIHDLALRYFSDDSDASFAHVLQLAFAMRYLWSHSVQSGQYEVNEAVSNWEFSDSTVIEGNEPTINNWLFRR